MIARFLVGAVATALTKVFLLVAGEAAFLGLEFGLESGFGPEFWRSSWKFAAFAGLVATTVGVFSGLISGAIAGVVDALGGGPDDPIGDVVAGVTGVLGLTANALYFGLGAFNTLYAEHRDLYG